ncbi:Short-chain dehydrogenase/reductase SDR [Caballeronia cordobensis]|uniref:Short-chain dehydrogenase/reductase SDR n=1 Tax=Caballeronia cordobensis TaxID=1353886 RepID=A0A158J8M0_CABCO|nr:short chain dehydrogenase [Caballeronia cordobensis]SAL64813.1 Short-chain dehydrogenase/reductase SDR [Caballeronia cordobensis]
MSKVLIIGATGTIGRAVVGALAGRHDVVEVGATRGSHRVNFKDPSDVTRLFESIGRVGHVVTAAGNVHFGSLAETTVAQFWTGLTDKLMGQVNVVLIGQAWVNDGGSFTLTSGITADQPVRDGTNAATVNKALEGFALGASIDLKRGLRINVVSPTMLEESVPSFGPYFPGFDPVSSSRVGLAYVRSIEGGDTGQVYRVGY